MQGQLTARLICGDCIFETASFYLSCFLQPPHPLSLSLSVGRAAYHTTMHSEFIVLSAVGPGKWVASLCVGDTLGADCTYAAASCIYCCRSSALKATVIYAMLSHCGQQQHSVMLDGESFRESLSRLPICHRDTDKFPCSLPGGGLYPSSLLFELWRRECVGNVKIHPRRQSVSTCKSTAACTYIIVRPGRLPPRLQSKIQPPII